MKNKTKIMDGNEAAAYIAYKTSEVCAIYPITPSSTMGEFCDEWSADGQKNVFGEIPRIMEMQSEAGAAGAIHGALQGGALASTFTCSQGLLLMIPNMYKIAGELTPTVFHIAARTLATHALSIFGDHSDVMSVRQTGWGMLFGRNAQEAMDMAMIAQAATLRSKVPFLNIFDGFRTSHELMKVEVIPDEVILKMIDEGDLLTLRSRAMSTEKPSIRGTAQNPDVFFQGREASNKYYLNVPIAVNDAMKRFAELTGRAYKLYEYFGHENPDRIIVIMGSGANTVHEMIDDMNTKGEKVGYIYVRLYRPLDAKAFVNAIPKSVKKIAVLDRCKEPGSVGEPLYQDVVSAIAEEWTGEKLKIIGGRYGLASKEFTPAMVKAVFDELNVVVSKKHFTVGIEDDITHLSLDYDKKFSLEKQHLFRGLFFGLGADGTVSANKNSIKIIGDTTDYYVQGYFVYDSKKSGSLTVSHLRFGKKPILSTYLVSSANFIACHQFNFINKYDILKTAEQGATFLLNTPFEKEEVWKKLPKKIQEEIINKKINFYVIDASKVAREAGMGSRVNTILQTCFFAIAGILTKEEAIKRIKDAIQKTYSDKGEKVVLKNFEAVDKAIENLHQIDYSKYKTGIIESEKMVADNAPAFVKNVLAKIMSFEGDELPVSAFPIDGTYPVATTQWEKRNIADKVPSWDAELCSQCGKCFLICPHAAIRCKVYEKDKLSKAPGDFKHIAPIGKEFVKENEAYTLQVAVEDCTGCNLCVEYCPIESKTEPGHKAINMVAQLPIKEKEIENWNFFLSLPEIDRSRVNKNTVKGTQLLQPLFEFSGACSGCGETPYVKLLSQLYGDKMVVANATGCSSIYGGNLPSTPWATNNEGCGPAWANSLFEDNAEFGLGIKMAYDKKADIAKTLLNSIRDIIGESFVEEILNADQTTEDGIRKQREKIKVIRQRIAPFSNFAMKQLTLLADHLVKKSHWIIGGDGWAYDIGFGGLDHVLSTGENVNIIVLDTEVYSNTGGQKSKSTPIGASAKFSVNGKTNGKKDLALQAIAHGSAYVAQIAMGANDAHTIKTIQEAEAFPGTSIIIAYSHCIAHGYDMVHGAEHQVNAVKSGYWPLFRYNPLKPKGERFTIDCKEPSLPLKEFLYNETRFSILTRQDPANAAKLLTLAELGISDHWERLNALKAL
ncbi:MAG: pyruvate:ferredoxin (flavodoxin) oxidoreductase [Bacteroidetes bacterium RIFCSPLOWO2_12_FULL_35_15]|nr:MAG: pyruvate:ferredoxin (flavodoxin) oxidoreductase [Bacteroidetes bacterium RIFCSPLOWO2_12_FULL_35_15]